MNIFKFINEGNKTYFYLFGFCIYYKRKDLFENYTRFLCFRFRKNLNQNAIKLENIEHKVDLILQALQNSGNTKFQEKIQKNSHSTIDNIDVFLKGIRPKTVLLIESNNYHAEVLPSIARYFINLGFNVDIFLSYKEYISEPFALFKYKKINIYYADNSTILSCLTNKRINKYEYIYFNSENVNYGKSNSVEFYKIQSVNKNKLLYMVHHPNSWNYSDEVKTLMLGDFNFKGNKKPAIIIPTFFGHINIQPKNKITHFVVVGNIQKERKNFDLLIKTVEKVLEEGFRDFVVDVIARVGELQIPESLKSIIQFHGSLSYPKMYELVRKSDFILTLMDIRIEEHHRYINEGFSGSILLSYGFRKPCLIEEPFSYKYELDKKNSIIYNGEENFQKAFKNAITATDIEYLKIQTNLSETVNKLYLQSLTNLQKTLN